MASSCSKFELIRMEPRVEVFQIANVDSIFDLFALG
jgi:hypothetical protein